MKTSKVALYAFLITAGILSIISVIIGILFLAEADFSDATFLLPWLMFVAGVVVVWAIGIVLVSGIAAGIAAGLRALGVAPKLCFLALAAVPLICWSMWWIGSKIVLSL